jgi:large subunit ribosomal protein L13
MTKTTTPSREQQLDKQWFIVDAEGKTLGQLAVNIARVLRGKHKPTFAAHVDMGDHVVVLNAGKFRVSGQKLSQKKYYTHSGYRGALKEISLEKLIEKKPTEALKKAVAGMIPRNKLKDKVMSKLHLFEGSEHDHEAQKPVELKVDG